MTRQEMVRSIRTKLTADRISRNRFLRLSFQNKDGFEARNRVVLAKKYAHLIREAVNRLTKLQQS